MSLDSASSQQKAPAYTPTSSPQVIGTRWAVAAGHFLASEAGARVLAAGGNAIDAGVAAGMTLGVVHCDMVSVAGVGPYPRATSAAYFRERHGNQIPAGLPRTVVPAAPDAWCTALERWGTMSFADVALAATEHAERGFAVSQFSANQMAANADKYRRWPSSSALYLRDGRALSMGEVLVQRELGETLRRMARAEAKAGGSREAGIRAARDEFYRGETAKRIAEFHRGEGGPLAASDLAEFSVEVGPALRTSFGRYEVAACGFWCQGPSFLQMLNLLDGVDLKALGHNSAAYLHRLIETIKLAFADRDAYYGDPHFVKVPADGLLSKAYAAVRRELVRERAWPQMPPAGDPDRLDSVRRPEAALPLAGGSHPLPGQETDALDTSYVSGVGCVVSPRGSQRWLDPDHPSVVAPGKRPRLTPAPAMAFTGGTLLMPFGTPGGDVQQQAMLQVFLNTTVFGMDLQAAIEAPRVASRSHPDSFWPHAVSPGKLEAERRIPRQTLDALVALGHSVGEWPEWEWRAGAVCGVKVGAENTRWAGADPRRGAHAIGRSPEAPDQVVAGT